MNKKILVLISLIFVILLIYIFNTINSESVQVENKESVKVVKSKTIQKKAIKKANSISKVKENTEYEAIPLMENTGTLFESRSDAKKWINLRKNDGNKYKIVKCKWRWEKSVKKYGKNKLVLYTVKRITK